jgi:hypothetical protein
MHIVANAELDHIGHHGVQFQQLREIKSSIIHNQIIQCSIFWSCSILNNGTVGHGDIVDEAGEQRLRCNFIVGTTSDTEQALEKTTFEWAKKAPSKDPTWRCVVLI